MKTCVQPQFNVVICLFVCLFVCGVSLTSGQLLKGSFQTVNVVTMIGTCNAVSFPLEITVSQSEVVTHKSFTDSENTLQTFSEAGEHSVYTITCFSFIFINKTHILYHAYVHVLCFPIS